MYRYLWDRMPFGRPGRPLTKSHPFVFGFYGALGGLVALVAGHELVNLYAQHFLAG